MRNLKSAYEQEAVSLSPAVVLHYLQKGWMSPERAIALLDVDQCHFIPRVDDQGVAPLIETGFPLYTAPSTGALACLYETFLQQKEEGQKSILVVSNEMILRERELYGEFLEQADGLIGICPRKGSTEKELIDYSHFLIGACCYPSVLLDNRVNPMISMLENDTGIRLANGQMLREGNLVTIEPLTGSCGTRSYQYFLRIKML